MIIAPIVIAAVILAATGGLWHAYEPHMWRPKATADVADNDYIVIIDKPALSATPPEPKPAEPVIRTAEPNEAPQWTIPQTVLTDPPPALEPPPMAKRSPPKPKRIATVRRLPPPPQPSFAEQVHSFFRGDRWRP